MSNFLFKNEGTGIGLNSLTFGQDGADLSLWVILWQNTLGQLFLLFVATSVVNNFERVKIDQLL